MMGISEFMRGHTRKRRPRRCTMYTLFADSLMQDHHMLSDDDSAPQELAGHAQREPMVDTHANKVVLSP